MMLPRSNNEPDQRIFLEFLYGVIVYEYKHITKKGSTLDHSFLAKAFASVVKTSTRHTSVLACPCHELIREYGLDTTDNPVWPNMIANFELRLFPQNRNSKAGEDIYLGYKITGSGVIMPQWQVIHTRQFLRRYISEVPADWKDDISVIIYDLRKELGMPGSGGKELSLAHGQLPGLSKFTRQAVVAKEKKITTVTKQPAAVQPSGNPKSLATAKTLTPHSTNAPAPTQKSSMHDARLETDRMNAILATKNAAREAKRQRKLLEKRQKKEQRELQRKQKAEIWKGKEQAQEQKEREAVAMRSTQWAKVIKESARRFIAFYYELVIYELMATYGAGVEISDGRIADAFVIAVEVLEKNSDVMIAAAAQIREVGLDDRIRVREYLKSYQPQLLSASVSQASSSSANVNAGYEISTTGIILPAWSAAEERAFLFRYDTNVPYTYKDDLAVLVWDLQNRLNFRGSGGEATQVHKKLQAVTKFKDLDGVKRAVFSQHIQERRHRLERQRSERLEQSRLQELGRQVGQLLELAPKKEEQDQQEHVGPNLERGDGGDDHVLCLQNDQSREHVAANEEDGDLQLKEREQLDTESQEPLQEETERAPREDEHGTIVETMEQAMDVVQEFDQPAEGQTKLPKGESEERHEVEVERALGELEGRRATEHVQEATQVPDQVVQDQMNLLLNMTRTTETRKQQILDLKDRLTTELSSYFKQDGLEVLLFGSYGTGLSDKGSDADFSLVNSDGSAISISVDTLAKALWHLGFINIIPISTARVPIASFDDPVTVVSCDMSLNQRHGALNSKLIDTYRQIDDRFMPLLFAIRYMARKNGIISGKLRFLTSYALVMMVITFLQTRPQPILPKLQHQPNMQKETVDGWDYSFDRHPSNHAGFGALNTETCAALLREFYRYFGYSFVYGAWEVNPREGVIHRKRDVNVTTDLKEKRKLIRAQMCIMDPFIRDRNVAGSITKKNVNRIKGAFRKASDALTKGNLGAAFLKI